MTVGQALIAYVLASLAIGSLVGHWLAARDGDIVAATRLHLLGFLVGWLARAVAAALAFAGLAYTLLQIT